MRILPDGYLGLDDHGRIEYLAEKEPDGSHELHDYSGHLILPGMVDAHTHLAQYAFAGTASSSLLEWLRNYTYPQEERFHQPRVAEEESEIFFRSLMENGTTTASVYVTSSRDATNRAFRAAQKSKLRIFAGQVLMDKNSPKRLTVSPARALFEMMELVGRWHQKERLSFIVTPRFAVSSTEALLKEAGQFARDMDLHVQTHISESKAEIQAALKNFPGYNNYTEIYDKSNLIGEKTLLAHAVHLSAEEREIIAQKKATIVHCPTSNRYLGSGIMPYSHYRKAGINVALGTDVAAGYSLSMFQEMREMIESSKLAAEYWNDDLEPASPEDALCAATLAGARALGIEKESGSLTPGKAADFIVVNDSLLHPLGEKSTLYNSPEERFSRLLYRFREEAIREVYVEGEKVFSR